MDDNSLSWSSTSNAHTTTSAATPPMNPSDIFLSILKTFSDYKVSLELGRYGCSLQIALGTVTNLLTVAVMTRPALITSTTCFYFAFLAVADLFVLYFTCLRRLLYIINDNSDVYPQSIWSCRILNFLAYFSYDFCSWILTVMTIDRFIAIRFPLKSAIICTKCNARISIVGLILLCTAKNCHFFFTFEISDNDGCLGRDAYAEFLEEAWPWIDASFYSFLPFSLLLIFNVLIIYCHRKSLRYQRSLHAATSLAVAAQGDRINRLNQRLTTMLLVVSFTFMVMTAPKAILFIIRREFFVLVTPDGTIDFSMTAQYSLVSASFDFLMWMNHAINFFLYCLSGTRFRQEFLQMIMQWRLCLCCKDRTKVFVSNQSGALKQATNQGDRATDKRRESSSSVISEDTEPAPFQLPVEVEDTLSRVNRWATISFGANINATITQKDCSGKGIAE